ncbi:hypothetical protein RV08_GL002429 [Enterococcus mundtii]|nr:hypothetical protein [Enterococcus hirae]OJG56933.1 hypothetical protein RV08_GL002429 [Enterococcus mundtii]
MKFLLLKTVTALSTTILAGGVQAFADGGIGINKRSPSDDNRGSNHIHPRRR